MLERHAIHLCSPALQVRSETAQVSEYLGDLRLRSVNVAMTRVRSRHNLSSTAAAFMELAAEQEDRDQAEQGLSQVRLTRGHLAKGSQMWGPVDVEKPHVWGRLPSSRRAADGCVAWPTTGEL